MGMTLFRVMMDWNAESCHKQSYFEFDGLNPSICCNPLKIFPVALKRKREWEPSPESSTRERCLLIESQSLMNLTAISGLYLYILASDHVTTISQWHCSKSLGTTKAFPFIPCSPEGFSQTYFPKGSSCEPPWIINTEGHITLNLLPVYRYGHLLSIDTKISTNH